MSNAPLSNLPAFARRIERLDAEIKTLNTDKKEIYGELKAFGYNVKAFKSAHRKAVAMSENPDRFDNEAAEEDLYLSALIGQADAKNASTASAGAGNANSEAPTRARTENA